MVTCDRRSAKQSTGDPAVWRFRDYLARPYSRGNYAGVAFLAYPPNGGWGRRRRAADHEKRAGRASCARLVVQLAEYMQQRCIDGRAAMLSRRAIWMLVSPSQINRLLSCADFERRLRWQLLAIAAHNTNDPCQPIQPGREPCWTAPTQSCALADSPDRHSTVTL